MRGYVIKITQSATINDDMTCHSESSTQPRLQLANPTDMLPGVEEVATLVGRSPPPGIPLEPLGTLRL